VILIFFLLPYPIHIIRFSPLPPSATNGAWAATIVAEGHTAFDDIDDLAAGSRYIIRGEIISERDRVMWVRPPIPGEPDGLRHLYTVYRIEVSDVFKGNIKVGDIIEVAQIRKVRALAISQASRKLPLNATGIIEYVILLNA